MFSLSTIMGGGGALKTAKVKVGKSEVGAKTSKPKSQFHIMANTNISSKQFNSWDEEKKENFVYYMGQFGEYIKNNYKMLVNTPSPKDLNTLKITSLSLNIEVQPKNGALHLDGYIFFNKFCQWRDRYKHINVAWECFVKKAGGKKGIFNAAFIPDYVTNAKEYSKKDKMPVFNFVDD